jgi:hypothetical protein
VLLLVPLTDVKLIYCWSLWPERRGVGMVRIRYLVGFCLSSWFSLRSHQICLRQIRKCHIWGRQRFKHGWSQLSSPFFIPCLSEFPSDMFRNGGWTANQNFPLVTSEYVDTTLLEPREVKPQFGSWMKQVLGAHTWAKKTLELGPEEAPTHFLGKCDARWRRLEESEVELFLRYSDAPNRAQLTAIDVPLRVPSEHHLLFYFWSGCIFWEYGCCAVTGVHLFVATQ